MPTVIPEHASLESDGTILPLDLIIEILEYLPVKSLVRFKCVSKPWCTLIKSPTFIRNHLLRGQKNRKMLLMRRCLLPSQHEGQDVLSVHDLDSIEEVRPHLSIPYLERYKLQKDLGWNERAYSPTKVCVLDCNGIVCISDHDRVILCNPALHEFRHLPSIPFDDLQYVTNDITGVGFGYDACTDVFKVVMIRVITDFVVGEELLTSIVIHLYNTSMHSWRQIDFNGTIMDPFTYTPNEIFFNGVCHWAAWNLADYNVPNILAFDISKEIFKQLEYPVDCIINHFVDVNLTVLNDCLTVLNFTGKTKLSCDVVVWAMKEYGVVSSWTKQFVITIEKFARPLCWNARGFLLLEARHDERPYFGIYTKGLKNLQIYGQKHTFRAVTYVESLISLNQLIMFP